MAQGNHSKRKDVARNREAILDAAARVLGADPDAGVDEIATAAGVNRATLYRHFGSRDDIVAALREEAAEQGREFVAQAVDGLMGDGGERHLLEILDDLVWASIQDATRYRQLMVTDPRRADEITARFGEISEAIVRRGQERGDLITDLPAALLSRQLIALVLSTVLAVDEGVATPEDAASGARRLLAGMRAPTAAARTS